MTAPQTVARVVDLLDPGKNVLFNANVEQARTLLAEGDADSIRRLDGQFALVATSGQRVRLARSIGRPLRYFIAKPAAGARVVARRLLGAVHPEPKAARERRPMPPAHPAERT